MKPPGEELLAVSIGPSVNRQVATQGSNCQLNWAEERHLPKVRGLGAPSFGGAKEGQHAFVRAQ
jgi:hypothetical protein